jgi:hypothetical protein
VGSGSSLIVGTYGDAIGTVCFISFHCLYIDLLMEICELKSVTNPKYCDIDSTFGLHDYTITVDIHNSKQSFLCEIFRKVFTKNLSKSHAVFQLIEPGQDARYYKGDSVRFSKDDLMYEWKSLITNGRVDNLLMLDLIVQDEFGETFHCCCTPVLTKPSKQSFGIYMD